MKIFSLGIFLAIVVISIQEPSQGMEAFFYSPTHLGRQLAFCDALDKIKSSIKISNTSYNHGEYLYTLQNITLDLICNEARQRGQVLIPEQITVIGARIQFIYNFNYSKSGSTQNVKGYGFGSVFSSPINYNKSINILGNVSWYLDGLERIQIGQRLKVKRLQPYNDSDLQIIQQMFDRAFNATPSTIEYQTLEQLNSLIPSALNDTLKNQFIGTDVQYNYTHSSKGILSLKLHHINYGFHVLPDIGAKFIFITQIKGRNATFCDSTSVPSDHLDWKGYGGHQTIHLNCMYEAIVKHMQQQSWLDTKLNSDWQTNAFQFYAGDLYDLINNLYLQVGPRSLLQGQCLASKNNLTFQSDRSFERNSYLLKVTYNCKIRSTSLQKQTIDILNFDAYTNFQIQVSDLATQLVFTILQADISKIQFYPVSNFYVNDLHLAMFKVDQCLKKLIKTNTFGTGFPSLPKLQPRTRVQHDYVVYYDAGILNSTKISADQ